jgi:hypothetical protein
VTDTRTTRGTPLPGSEAVASTGFEREIEAIQAALQSIEDRLAPAAIPPEALGDIKSAVDDIRLRVWAVMQAANSRGGQAALERFRLRRAIEICHSLAEDLAAGRMGAAHPGLPVLQHLARRLADAIEAAAKPPS